MGVRQLPGERGREPDWEICWQMLAMRDIDGFPPPPAVARLSVSDSGGRYLVPMCSW
jgi:hypothetical protein